MRILIFAGRRGIVEMDLLDPRPIGCRNLGNGHFQVAGYWLRHEQRREAIQWFHQDPDAVLVVDQSFVMGWKAPKETVVLFHPSWPYPMNDPHSVQAVGRVTASALKVPDAF